MDEFFLAGKKCLPVVDKIQPDRNIFSYHIGLVSLLYLIIRYDDNE
jgi:hypothetical protein